MSNTKISALTAATAALAADELPINEAGLSKKLTVAQIHAYIYTQAIYAQLSASVNDWNPAGLGTCTVIRITADNAYNITGITAQTDGTIIRLLNLSNYSITLPFYSGSSSVANRFQTPNQASVVIRSRGSVEIYYSRSDGNWYVLAI